MLAFIAVVLVLCVVVAVVGQPLSRAVAGEEGDLDVGEAGGAASGASELEAECEAKLREIRDAELDWRTGKLSEQDWRELDAVLRSDAAALLKADAAPQPEVEAPPRDRSAAE